MRRAALWTSNCVLRTSRLTTQQSTLNALCSQRRRLHQPVGLPYDASEGLGRFMSAETLQVVAVDYQKGLLKRLDDEVKGEWQLLTLCARAHNGNNARNL